MSVTLYDGVVLTVEIGFSTTSGSNAVPLNGNLSDITWTDVSAYVRDLSTKRGRNNELDSFSPGTMSVTLSNADRRFDPEYTAGPYYGAVTPSRPIRVRANYAAQGVKDLFLGWVDGWAQQYEQPNDATVVVTATDGFKILNQLMLSGSWDFYTNELAPWSWWKFGESAPVTVAYGYGSRPADLNWITNTGAGTYAQATSSLIPDSSSGAALFDGNSLQSSGWSSPRQDFYDVNLMTLEVVFSTTMTTPGSYGIAKFSNSESVMGVGMVVDASGVGTIKFWQGTLGGADLVYIRTSSVVVNDGNTHIVHLANYWNFLPTPINPTVDGIQSSGSSTRNWTAGYTPSVQQAQVGQPMTQLDGDNFTSYFTGTIDEIVIHSQLLTLAQVMDRYELMTATYGAGDSTSTRMGALLDMCDWMTDARSLSGGNSTVSSFSVKDQTVLDALKEAEAAEQGRMFIAGNGYVTLIPRLSIFTNSTYSTSQATFGDGSGESAYSDIGFSYDDRLIVNRSTVSRQDGATYTIDDTSSQANYFIRNESIGALTVDTDDFARQVAAYRVATYAQPSTRIESLQVDARQSPTDLFPKVLTFDVGTRITVNRRPQGVGSVLSKQLLIEGVEHTISADRWVTRWGLSPVPFDVFILDSATKGVLDTNRLGL
jgi:hypothetical protein